MPRQAIFDRIHPEDRQRYLDAIARTLQPEGNGHLAIDVRALLPSGVVRWLHIRLQVVFSDIDGKRKPVRGICAAREVTTERPPHIVFSPEIRSIVAQAVGDETNPLKKSRKLFRWVCENIRYCTEMEYSTIPSLPAKALAARPEIAQESEPSKRVEKMYRILYGRPPTPDEIWSAAEFIRGEESFASPGTPSALSPWERYAQVLLESNEFVFVD